MSNFSGLNVLWIDSGTVDEELLGPLGIRITQVESLEKARSILEQESFPLALLGMESDRGASWALLAEIRQKYPHMAVAVLTQCPDVHGARLAFANGALDYLLKPLEREQFRELLSRSVRTFEADPVSRKEVCLPGERKLLVSRSRKMVEVYKAIARAAASPSSVLIMGETGSGKELVAKAIHASNHRGQGKFVVVNCSALAETLFESEVFGHIKGAFTGALANKRGLLEEAEGGTLFLDEIGDVSLALQIKLLRAIQEKEYKPIGTNEVRRVDARIICCTHRDLARAVEQGLFREDLYYRINVITIIVPPLRERGEDIEELVHFFVRQAGRLRGQHLKLDRALIPHLKSYSWPGNVRELEHAIERASVMASTSVLVREDFPKEIFQSSTFPRQGNNSNAMTLSQNWLPLDELQRSHVTSVLKACHMNISRAARVLQMDRVTLYRKAKAYGILLPSTKKRFDIRDLDPAK